MNVVPEEPGVGPEETNLLPPPEGQDQEWPTADPQTQSFKITEVLKHES